LVALPELIEPSVIVRAKHEGADQPCKQLN